MQHPLYGHEFLRARLANAIRASRFPQASLLMGPRGVGKQRLGLWVAQTILCESAASPCGTCRSCVQVQGLSHPDLHWFIPFPPPKRRSSDPGKQVNEAEQIIAELVEERRKQPQYTGVEATASHPLASVRLLHRRLALRPFHGAYKVFLVGDADRLIVQEASTEAANALLKALEEPPPGTFILLTTHAPSGILPTIRSRCVPVRVPPVQDEAVLAFLNAEMDVSGSEAQKRVHRVQGIIGDLIGTADGVRGTRGAERLFGAIKTGAVAWAELALSQPPWGARADFTEMLDAAAERLRLEIQTRSAAGRGNLYRPLRALQLIADCRAEAQGNANPQMALAVLCRRMADLR